jgi:hypothetical protein
MGHTVPRQHPAVVLRSHYLHLRAMLAIAMLAVAGLTIAVVILAGNGSAPTSAASAGGRTESATQFRVPSHAADHGGAPVPDLRAGRRYDGGPEEGTRGVVVPAASSTRYDGGPEEGSRGSAR